MLYEIKVSVTLNRELLTSYQCFCLRCRVVKCSQGCFGCVRIQRFGTKNVMAFPPNDVSVGHQYLQQQQGGPSGVDSSEVTVRRWTVQR